jgi:hypothetical protein
VCYFALVDVNGGLSNTCVYGIATSSTVSNSTGTYIVGSIGAPDLSVCVAIAQVGRAGLASAMPDADGNVIVTTWDIGGCAANHSFVVTVSC